MPLSRWRKLHERVVHQNPYFSYLQERYRLPSGKEGDYYYVHTGGSAMVVPVTCGGELLLVNQYRYLMDHESLEFPCGGIEEGATPLDTARAELAQETGRGAGRLELVGHFNPFNGVTDERCHVYIACGLYEVSDAVPDETEEFELVTLTPAELSASIQTGRVWDGMTMAAWQIAGARIKEVA